MNFIATYTISNNMGVGIIEVNDERATIAVVNTTGGYDEVECPIIYIEEETGFYEPYIAYEQMRIPLNECMRTGY